MPLPHLKLEASAHPFSQALERHAPWFGIFFRFCGCVARKYRRDDCLSYAASLCFWLMASLVPLGAMLLKLLAVMLGSSDYGPEIYHKFQALIPYFPANFYQETLEHSRSIGGLGFSWLLLLFGGNWGVAQLDHVLSHIFGTRVRKHRQTRGFFFLRRLILLLGGLLFLALFLFVQLMAVLPPRVGCFLPWTGPVLGLLALSLILQHMPRRHVEFRHAFVGALVAGLFWYSAKWLFSFYLSLTPTWGLIYGSLSGLMAALVFLYYTCAIFLLGAEITSAFYLPASRSQEAKPFGRSAAEIP